MSSSNPDFYKTNFYKTKLNHFMGRMVVVLRGRDSVVCGPLAREVTGRYMVGEYPGVTGFEVRDISGIFSLPVFDSCLIEVKTSDLE